MAQYVLDVAPARFALAGHSMGARVALEMVRREPERIERLALLDTGVHPEQPGERDKRMALLALAREGMGALADRWLTPMVYAQGPLAAEVMPELRAMVLRKTPQIFADQVAALLGRPDAKAVLAQIACPVLVGVGRHDQWSPPAQHEPIAAAIPQATYVVFEDAGHMSTVEAPEAVTEALAAWMAGSPEKI
jgi:pimeloyl-ACP methyl ester carboxylesterase